VGAREADVGAVAAAEEGASTEAVERVEVLRAWRRALMVL